MTSVLKQAEVIVQQSILNRGQESAQLAAAKQENERLKQALDEQQRTLTMLRGQVLSAALSKLLFKHHPTNQPARCS